jgi:ribonuclease P protein component
VLSKIFRLNLREQEEFFSRCSKKHTPYFSFFYQTADQFQTTVIVSKKVCHLATERNAVKRKFRAALQQILPKINQVGIQLAIVVHAKGTTLSVSQIAEQLHKNVQKIRT